MSAATIIIAGTEWPVPLLAPRQNRIVVPALMALGGEPHAQYDRLLDIVFAALTRAHASLARDEFENWPIATHELLAALPVIAKQTGLLRTCFDKLGMRKNPHPEPVEGPDWDALIAEVV